LVASEPEATRPPHVDGCPTRFSTSLAVKADDDGVAGLSSLLDLQSAVVEVLKEGFPEGLDLLRSGANRRPRECGGVVPFGIGVELASGRVVIAALDGYDYPP